MEIWKDMDRYEGVYQVSNLGNVKSLLREVNCKGTSKRKIEEQMLNPYTDKGGYKYVRLSKNSKHEHFTVHRLVAIAFIPNVENKPQVNHINSIRSDNRLENLEWVTCSENHKHAFRTGSRKNNSEAQIKLYNEIARKISIPVLNIQTGIYYDSVKEAVILNGIKESTLRGRLNGKLKNKTNLIYA